MNISSIGGGPAGLYFGLPMKLQVLSLRVVVVERDKLYRRAGKLRPATGAGGRALAEADVQDRAQGF